MKIKFKNGLMDVVICDLVLNGINEGKVVCNWEELALLMDDDLRNQVHNEFRGESNEEFLAAYLERDPDFMHVIQQNALSIGEGDDLYTIEEGRVDSEGRLNSGPDEKWMDRIYYTDLEVAMKDFAEIDVEGGNYKAIIAYELTNDDCFEYDFGLVYDGEMEIVYGEKAKKYVYDLRQEEVNSFSELIKEARIKKGLTQREVAEAIGISLGHYQHFEYSKRVPSGEIMIKLIKALDLDLNDIEKALESSKNA